MSQHDSLGIKVFADGADLEGILRLADEPQIAGFTTNPTLMRRRASRTTRGSLGRSSTTSRTARSRSRSSLTTSMRCAARRSSSVGWGPNVYVKIPVTNTKGESSAHWYESSPLTAFD